MPRSDAHDIRLVMAASTTERTRVRCRCGFDVAVLDMRAVGSVLADHERLKTAPVKDVDDLVWQAARLQAAQDRAAKAAGQTQEVHP